MGHAAFVAEHCGSVSDRLSELTPLFEVANEARDVGELPPDASP
jgi:hypothetical protein